MTLAQFLALGIWNIATAFLGVALANRARSWLSQRSAITARLDAHQIPWRWYERNGTLLSRLIGERLRAAARSGLEARPQVFEADVGIDGRKWN